ncbi:MAG: hypothetical protein ACXV5P_05075 [Halobacteriota archaeon]
MPLSTVSILIHAFGQSPANDALVAVAALGVDDGVGFLHPRRGQRQAEHR